MKALIVTPAPKGSLVGNRHTAQRYARILREIGVRASVIERWDGTPCDLLVALHARKSAASIRHFARKHPLAPLVVVLTGTDLYEDTTDAEPVRESLDLASRIVVLQPEALAALDERWRGKTRAVLQSADRASGESRALEGVFEIASVGHMRGVKDPFLAAEAVKELPKETHVRVAHVGRALDRGMEARAKRESELSQGRWRWLGERTHGAVLHFLARTQGYVQTSYNEGGSIALAEAIVAHKPIVCTRIPGAIGMLGPNHAGFFEPGDAHALATLLERLESDAEWRAELIARSVELAPQFSFEREVEAWRSLLAEMGLCPERPRFRLTSFAPRIPAEDLAEAVRAGFAATPKTLPCRFFYDAEGSAIFEEICALPEYYLTRAEDEILARHADEILSLVPQGSQIVELGSGSGTKTRHLIAAAIRRNGRAHYLPIDISRSALEGAAVSLLSEFETLRIDAVEAEYREGLERLSTPGRAPRLYLWLGSNVGNFDRDEAAHFLGELSEHMESDDRLVLGVDRKKPEGILVPAYDDAQGVTARFNLNLLERVARELDARFDPSCFRHVALWNDAEGRIEMHLESRVDQTVRIEKLDLDVSFAEGERIHTENSYKYDDAQIEELARAAGLSMRRTFTDEQSLFSTCVLAPRLDLG